MVNPHRNDHLFCVLGCTKLASSGAMDDESSGATSESHSAVARAEKRSY